LGRHYLLQDSQIRSNEDMSAEIKALEQFFAAVNRNGMQAITCHFDPQIVRIESLVTTRALGLSFMSHNCEHPRLLEVAQRWP